MRVVESYDRATVPDTVEAFLSELQGPTILTVPGRNRSLTRGIATLLHGDEPSGVRAVHAWLTGGEVPAVDVLVFVGAVAASLIPPGFAHRHVPGGSDLNRHFLCRGDSEESSITREALELIRRHAPEAMVDLHNTSGETPPYGLGPRVDPVCLGLTSLFAPVFLSTGAVRLGTLVEALVPSIPAVVLECGRSGDADSDAVASEGLQRYVRLEHLEDAVGSAGELRMLENPTRIVLRPGTRLSYSAFPMEEADVTLLPDIDRHNLVELAPGTHLGWVRQAGAWPFSAIDPEGRESSNSLLEAHQGRLVVRRPFVPVMTTTNRLAALSDCLCYAAHAVEGEAGGGVGG